jgi:dihydroorotate dehydrogenase electron transfer subunit
MSVVEVEEVLREASHTKTYRFRAPFVAEPAQFVMVWVPGVDEVPMALSYLGSPMGVTVQDMGDSTTAMHARVKKGNRIGVRGPFGNTFDLDGQRFLLVCGGTGTASIITVAEALKDQGKAVTTLIGARTKEQFIFVDRARKYGEVRISTDDGSEGFHGQAPILAKELMDRGSYDRVITCGPEKMMKKVVELAVARKIPVQVSMERYMKCGVGICDACALDGLLVCTDGPIFDGERLLAVADFGRWRRDQCGRRVPL